MNDLTAFRDHARKQAARPRIVNRDRAGAVTSTSGPTATERGLWTQLADAIDAYLEGPAPAVDLFGETSVEPSAEPSAEPEVPC